MPRKSKNLESKYNCHRKTVSRGEKNEDCVYIGKDNKEKWTNMKKILNFASDQEFASYLLDLFSNEKSYFCKKTLQKEIENKPPNSLTSEQDINFNQESPDSKNLSFHPNGNQTENSSSVIVINKSVISDISEDRTCMSEESNCNLFNNAVIKNPSLNEREECINKTVDNQVITQGSCNFDLVRARKQVKSKENVQESSEVPEITQPKGSTIDSDVNKDETTKKLQLNKPKSDSKAKVEVKPRKEKKKKISESKDPFLCEEGKIPKLKRKRMKDLENSTCVKEIENEGATSITITKEEDNEPQTTLVPVNLAPKPLDSDDEQVAITIRLCGDCELHHIQDACPLRNPIGVIPDAVSLSEWSSGKMDGSLKSFAEVSIPSCLELRECDSQHGPSVVARQTLQAFVQFGPLVGRPILEREIPDDSTMEHIWELCEGSTCHYLSTRDVSASNWLRYVRPAPVRSSRNVEVVLRNDQLMFITTTIINEGEELLFWMENTNNAWSHKKLCKTKCGGCNLSFSHTLYYRLHCAVFHDPTYSLTVRKYHCKVCGCSVLGKENIVKHAAEEHNGKGAYQCQYCNKFFLRLNYLEMHRTYGCSANPNRSRPLCDYCGRKFCQPQKLKVHIKRMHSEMLEVLRDFQCKLCLKILGSRAALHRHFKEVHQKDVVGACTCDRCGKMFQNKSNLKIHMLTHSGIKPFKCKEPDCPAAFTTKQCLQFHYRKIHGLEEGSMPPIERSVEYTFDAYAGSRRPNSVNSDSQCSSDGEDSSEKYSNEEQSPLSPPISVTGEQVNSPPLEVFNKVVASKGSKKWIGGSHDDDHPKSNVFDFDEDDVKEQDINVSHIEEEPIPMLFHNCKQDSANASLLVEAALDAAERDIEMPAKIHSPMSLVTNKEPYPVLRSHLPHSPLSLSRPVSPVDYPIQDQSQSPHLAMESCYSTMSPRHPYSLMFPERTPHYDFRLSPPPGQIDTFHLEDSRYDYQRRTDENSNDEGVNVVQNLSLGLKNKPIQSDIPYKYDNLEERSFESVEGLDMSRTSGYHHSFVSVTPRYPPTLYEPRTYSHTDVLRVVNFSHSVDLSLPRSHHQLTPPMNQTLIEPIRIISPPPPYQGYPLSNSPLPYSRPSHSPTYHHYNTTY